jgi:hypothetical protein
MALQSKKLEKADLEQQLARHEIVLAEAERRKEEYESELEMKGNALLSLNKECDEKKKAYEEGEARRASELQTLQHLKDVMNSVKIAPAVANRIKDISVFGAADIVCSTPTDTGAHIDCGANMKIHRLQFASYGLATGVCPNLKMDPTCHPADITVLQNLCLGRQSCDVPNPIVQPCAGAKWVISVICSRTSDVVPPRSDQWTLSAVGDDMVELFVATESPSGSTWGHKVIPMVGPWTEAHHANFPAAGITAISAHIVDTGACVSGFMFTAKDQAGAEKLVSNGKWKCRSIDRISGDWTSPYYDDSQWDYAVQLAMNGLPPSSPWGFTNTGVSNNAWWISSPGQYGSDGRGKAAGCGNYIHDFVCRYVFGRPDEPSVPFKADFGKLWVIKLPASTTWVVAEQTCQKYGWHLVSIHNAAQNTAVMRALQASQTDGTGGFIGINRILEPAAGQAISDPKLWAWSDGTPVDYMNWAGGEPNNWSLKEYKVHMYRDSGQWNDHYYDFPAFVCLQK